MVVEEGDVIDGTRGAIGISSVFIADTALWVHIGSHGGR